MVIFFQIVIGIGLAATCGFRAFVPLFAMSLAGVSGVMEFASGFEWIGTYPALIVFGIATVVEIVAYFVPFVDNVLNAITLPFSIIAGVIIVASVITDIDPVIRWSLALIAGGGVATGTGLISNAIHLASTMTSGGTANPAVSTVETGATGVMAALSIIFPVVSLVLIILIIFFVVRYLKRKKVRPQPFSRARAGHS